MCILGEAETGYQSIHITASLKGGFSVNLKQEKFEKFKNIRFEIQVRTMLQEAWAAVNHKKSYKYQGISNRENQTQIKVIYQAALELLDDELEEDYSRGSSNR